MDDSDHQESQKPEKSLEEAKQFNPDDSKGSKEVFHLENSKPLRVETTKYGQLSSDECYVVRYSSKDKNLHIIYTWKGKWSSPENYEIMSNHSTSLAHGNLSGGIDHKTVRMIGNCSLLSNTQFTKEIKWPKTAIYTKFIFSEY